jgi:hypothetical protein
LQNARPRFQRHSPAPPRRARRGVAREQTNIPAAAQFLWAHHGSRASTIARARALGAHQPKPLATNVAARLFDDERDARANRHASAT